MSVSIQASALAYYDAGASVIPVAQDATKRPLVTEWAPFQTARASREQTAAWFTGNNRSIGVICGAVSGNREGIDIDNKPRPGYPDAEELINQMASMVDADDPTLWDTLAIESSPSMGWHILYRCQLIEGNQKLAMRPATAEDRAAANNPKLDRITLIETRGEGGYFVSSPSPGYSVFQGDITRPPQITPEQRATLFRAGRALNYLASQPVPPQNNTAMSQPAGERPGDLYNAAMTAEDHAGLLERHGWHRCMVRRDGVILLRRPGKPHGWSATIGYGGTNLLRVFSSNAYPFDMEVSYTPFHSRAVLEYHGDFAAVTRALVTEGYHVYTAYTGPLVVDDVPVILQVRPDPMVLPRQALQPDALAAQGCPWLDTYIAYSRRWSPRSYDDFHEAVGVWLLSTVAARRVLVHFGKEQYTPLFIALAGRSTLHAKTTAAEVGRELLDAAGLGWMLADDSSTPQKFVRDRTQHVSDEYKALTGEALALANLRLKFAGQVGWWYDEFGMLLHAMARSGSSMSDFSGLLRRFDDCAPSYVASTIGRPTDRIIAPYVALLASLTPADLRPLMRRGSSAWSDGFWARWAFVTPPLDDVKTDRFPAGRRVPPADLSRVLRAWHTRLGEPTLLVTDDIPQVGPLPQQALTMSGEVADAYYAYNDAIIDLMRQGGNDDLDAWHGRAAIRALRLAALFASVEGSAVIDVRHWARAQQIAERWRFSLYRLYEQVSLAAPTEKRDAEDTVMGIIERFGAPTVREISQRVRTISAGEIQDVCEKLVRAGMVEAVPSQRTVRFRLPVVAPASVDM